MDTMAIPQDTLSKLNSLPQEKLSIVVQMVDQLAASPVDIFRAIREDTASNPMTDEEVDRFVDSVRQERLSRRKAINSTLK